MFMKTYLAVLKIASIFYAIVLAVGMLYGNGLCYTISASPGWWEGADQFVGYVMLTPSAKFVYLALAGGWVLYGIWWCIGLLAVIRSPAPR